MAGVKSVYTESVHQNRAFDMTQAPAKSSAAAKGAERIRIESPRNTDAFIQEYDSLVSRIAGYVNNATGFRAMSELGLMECIFKSVYEVEGLRIRGSNDLTLAESVKSNSFDCDTITFVIYDVINRLGKHPAIKAKPDMVAAYGHMFLKLGDSVIDTNAPRPASFSESKKMYRYLHILKESEMNYPAYNSVGNLLRKEGRYPEAEAAYKKAIRLAPSIPDSYISLGRLCSFRKNYTVALSNLNIALQIVPFSPEAYLSRGEIYSFQGKHDLAILDFTKVIQTDPKNESERDQLIEAYINRSDEYAKKGRYDQAISDANMVIQLNPKEAYGYGNRGLAYLAKKEYAKAEYDLKIAVSINPKVRDFKEALKKARSQLNH